MPSGAEPSCGGGIRVESIGAGLNGLDGRFGSEAETLGPRVQTAQAVSFKDDEDLFTPRNDHHSALMYLPISFNVSGV